MRPYRIGNEGITEDELVLSESDFNDFDDRNKTFSPIEDYNKEKKDIVDAALATERTHIDPAFYGYNLKK